MGSLVQSQSGVFQHYIGGVSDEKSDGKELRYSVMDEIVRDAYLKAAEIANLVTKKSPSLGLVQDWSVLHQIAGTLLDGEGFTGRNHS